MATKAERAESAARAADVRRQETGPRQLRPLRMARTHIHAVHPEHGEPVVFLPGEAPPDWVEAEREDLR
jgi:hypothetical protein